MYMSRITLRADHGHLGRMAEMVGGGGYRTHQALWRLFEVAPDVQRDFLYRQEPQGGMPRFLMVSRRRPQDREGLWSVESKDYAPQLNVGQRLAFSLRVNPVVTRSDENRHQHRHDVVMDLKKRLRSEEETRLRQAELVQQAAWEWLLPRAEKAGFSVISESFLAEEYRQHELRKNKGKPIRFSTVDCNGVLTVTDVAQMTETLFNGIGPSKAFGCGLLLVRRF
jgi:CRISPR system Cascade subunit CasE